jgi:hypothetical protein
MPTMMLVQSASNAELTAMNGFMELFKIITVAKPEMKPSPKPETPKEPTKALNVMTDHLVQPLDWQDLHMHYYKLYWNFFAIDYGKQVACREDPVRVVERPRDPGETARPYPGGEFSLELFGEVCTYRNSGDNVGKLFCGNRAIECFWDPPTKDPARGENIDENNYTCKEGWTRQTIFTCPF